MRSLRRLFGCFALSAALLSPVVIGAGCAGRVRVYDQYHADWHHWDAHEDVVYRGYLNDRHEQYREFNKLTPDQQHDYWNYRHDHPDTH